jgi:hypothetical protein
MKTVLLLIPSAVAWLHLTSCSCAVTGETYAPAKGSRKITPAMLGQFAKESDFRKKSEADYRRGRVNLSYESEIGGLGLNGSFCSLPHELLFSSSSEVFQEVSNAEKEVKAWFDKKGVHLQKVTFPTAHPE